MAAVDGGLVEVVGQQAAVAVHEDVAALLRVGGGQEGGGIVEGATSGGAVGDDAEIGIDVEHRRALLLQLGAQRSEPLGCHRIPERAPAATITSGGASVESQSSSAPVAAGAARCQRAV